MVNLKLIGLLVVLSLQCFAGLKFGSYNIRTFDKNGSYTNKVELKEIIRKANFDFYSVEEIVNAESFKNFIKINFPQFDVVLSSCGGAGRQKLGFVYNRFKVKMLSIREDDILSDVKSSGCDSLRPAMIGEFQQISNGRKFNAIAVHLKAGSGSRNYSRRNTQYAILGDLVEAFQKRGQKDIVIMGDFNTTGYALRDADYKNFRKFLNDHSLSTSARYIRCTSYWGGSDYSDNIEEASTLDHIVYSDNFMGNDSLSFDVYAHCEKARCRDTYVNVLGTSYEEVSDHCPISLQVND